MKANAGLDKWAAEKVGLTVYVHQNGKIKILTIPKDWEFDQSEWTLSDARCREIVREYFKIRTVVDDFAENNPLWKAYVFSPELIEPNGKTIADVEIACIQAIYEKEGDGS